VVTVVGHAAAISVGEPSSIFECKPDCFCSARALPNLTQPGHRARARVGSLNRRRNPPIVAAKKDGRVRLAKLVADAFVCVSLLYVAAQLAAMRSRLSDCFGLVRPFFLSVPTSASGMLAMFVAGRSARSLCPPADLLQERFAKIRPTPRFHLPEVHASAFAMVPTLRQPEFCIEGKRRACGWLIFEG
jgi:hypothetical protein